jgi:hypothetical protein
VKLGTNWASKSIKTVRMPKEGKVEPLDGADKTILGTSPDFVDPSHSDYCLAKGSPARGVAGELAKIPEEYLPTLQYKKDRGHAPRPPGKDLGAFVCD